MNALRLALVLALCAPAISEAATVREYTPGAAPCAGACSLDWAKAEFGVPDGDPARMTIPQGSHIRLMSYAENGKPFATPLAAVFARDQPGIGYPFTASDGVRAIMVRIDACKNWAVITAPQTSIAAQTEPPESIAQTILGQTFTASAPIAPQRSGRLALIPLPIAPNPPSQPETAPPIPLPATALLLVLALGALIFAGRKYK